MELNCANKIKNLLFLLGILVLTFAPVHVWAGDNLEGGTYYASSFPSSAENIGFDGDVTLIMDEDMEKAWTNNNFG